MLRRGESGAGSSLHQVLDRRDSQEGLGESLDALMRQTEESDRALRRDLAELRAEVRRERDIAGKVESLLLVALVPMVVLLLISGSLKDPKDIKDPKDPKDEKPPEDRG